MLLGQDAPSRLSYLGISARTARMNGKVPRKGLYWRRPILKAGEQERHGSGPVRAAISLHILRRGGADPVPGQHRRLDHAHRHLPRDQDPGGDGDLELHRAQHARDGAARHHLQPVRHLGQRQRHQEHRGPDHGGAVGAEDLLPAGRQSRPRDLPDRGGDQFHPCPDATRHPAARRRAIQRLERAGAADQPRLRHAERAAALRLRHLSRAPAARPDRRHHPANAGRRQVPPDHGRHRPHQAGRQGPDAAGCGERRQCPEPHRALGHRQDRRPAICRAHKRDARIDRRAERHPDQGGERRHGVREGCRAGA